MSYSLSARLRRLERTAVAADPASCPGGPTVLLAPGEAVPGGAATCGLCGHAHVGVVREDPVASGGDCTGGYS